MTLDVILGIPINDIGSYWNGEWVLQTVVNLVIILCLSCICINVGCCMRYDFTCDQLPIIVEYGKVCSIIICYGKYTWHGMLIPANLKG